VKVTMTIRTIIAGAVATLAFSAMAVAPVQAQQTTFVGIGPGNVTYTQNVGLSYSGTDATATYTIPTPNEVTAGVQFSFTGMATDGAATTSGPFVFQNLTGGTFFVKSYSKRTPITINLRLNQIKSENIATDGFLKPNMRNVVLELEKNYLTYLPEKPFRDFLAANNTVKITDFTFAYQNPINCRSPLNLWWILERKNYPDRFRYFGCK